MKVLVDVSVVLDVLLERQPHVRASSAVWAAIEGGSCEGLLAAHAVTTIHYLVRRELGNVVRAGRIVITILKVFGVAAVDNSVLRGALVLACPDFEDSVTSEAARHAGCDFIVTRDPKGFRGSSLECFTPKAALPLLSPPRTA